LKAEVSNDLARDFVSELEGLGRTNVTHVENQWRAVTNRLDLAEIKQESEDSEGLLPVVAHALTLFGNEYGPQPGHPLIGWIHFREKTNALSREFGEDWGEVNRHELVPMAAEYQRGRAKRAATEIAISYLKKLQRWPVVSSAQKFESPADLDKLILELNGDLKDADVLGDSSLIENWSELEQLRTNAMAMIGRGKLLMEIKKPRDYTGFARSFRILEKGREVDDFWTVDPTNPLKKLVDVGPLEYEIRDGEQARVKGKVMDPWGLLFLLWSPKEGFQEKRVELLLEDKRTVPLIIKATWAQ
jgi:hypothetical protein